MEYQYLEEEIEISKKAIEMLTKAKEQEKAKLKKGYVYIRLKEGLEVLTPTDKDGKPIFTKEQLLKKYNLI